MISKVQALTAGAWLTAILLAAACGSSVVGQGNSGTTGTGGETGTGGGDHTTGPGGFGGFGVGGFGGCGAMPLGCCTDSGQVCCVLCTDAATGTGGAGGGPATCGGFVGTECAPSDYCAFPDQQCGDADGTGVCTPRPTGCDKPLQPTCGCDHMVYDSPCLAAAAGADVDDLGGCTPPAGMFGCGSGFCQLASQYCLEVPSGTSTEVTSYTCEPLPASCGSSPSCACLSDVACGGNCETTTGAGIQVVCETN